MTRKQPTHDRDPSKDATETGGPQLSETELDGVVGGTGGLVHETVHAGTTAPPRGGNPAPAPARQPRSPPTGMP